MRDIVDGDEYEPYDDHPAEEALLSQKEAAEIFGVSRQTLSVWRRKGLLPTYRIGVGRTVGFKRSDIEALKAKRQQVRRFDQ